MVPPDSSENRILCIGCLRSEVWGWAAARRARGLFSINTRSSWVTVDFDRPFSGETPPDLAFCGDRIGISFVDVRGDPSWLPDVVIGVRTFCRLRGLLGVDDGQFVAGFRGERGGWLGEPNAPGRRRSMGDTGGEDERGFLNVFHS